MGFVVCESKRGVLDERRVERSVYILALYRLTIDEKEEEYNSKTLFRVGKRVLIVIERRNKGT